MPSLVLLGLIAGLPLILMVVLRVKPLYLFVSIVCGYFWAEFLGYPAELMLGSMIHVRYLSVIIRLVLLLIPMAVTLLLMRKTLTTRALPFQFGLLLADSILLATLLLPLLTPGVQGSLYGTGPGNVFRQGHDIVIPAVSAIHVLVMWFMRPRHHDDMHGKHKKH